MVRTRRQILCLKPGIDIASHLTRAIGGYRLFNALDYIVLIILALSILIGYQKGLIRTLGGMVSTLAGLGIAFLFRQPAAHYLEQHFGVVTDLTAFLEKRLLNTVGVSDPTVLTSSLPFINEGVAAIHNQITEFSFMIMVTICFIILYAVSSRMLKIICALLERAIHWGIMGRVNHLGGVILIAIQSTLIMAILAGVLISPVGLGAQIGIKSASRAEYYVEGSVLMPYLLKTFEILTVVVDQGV